MTFKELGLSDALLKAINKKGYKSPSPIQEKAIPLILKKKDVLASAQTGTGKTAGFTLPLLQLIDQEGQKQHRQIKALIITPTRELAAQILAEVQDYSKYLNIKSTVIFGGVKANPQIKILRQGVEVLVATPGRLLDLHQQKVFSLNHLEILVLDEADRMLDMGFARDIQKILKIIPKRRQNLLFSATFSKEIKKMAQNVLYNPVAVEATPENTTAEKVNHSVYHVNKSKKNELIIKLINDGNWEQVLVFTRTKHGANRLCKKMIAKGISAGAIHGNKSQNQRTKVLADFKSKKLRVLVATDIAARGLDIPKLPYVINFELPNVPEDYVHRIGRTGRAGASGDAISLVAHDEQKYLKDIEKLLNQKLETKVMPGFEQVAELEEDKPKPKKTFTRKPKSKPKHNKGNNHSGNKKSW